MSNNNTNDNLDIDSSNIDSSAGTDSTTRHRVDRKAEFVEKALLKFRGYKAYWTDLQRSWNRRESDVVGELPPIPYTEVETQFTPAEVIERFGAWNALMALDAWDEHPTISRLLTAKLQRILQPDEDEWAPAQIDYIKTASSMASHWRDNHPARATSLHSAILLAYEMKEEGKMEKAAAAFSELVLQLGSSNWEAWALDWKSGQIGYVPDPAEYDEDKVADPVSVFTRSSDNSKPATAGFRVCVYDASYEDVVAAAVAAHDSLRPHVDEEDRWLTHIHCGDPKQHPYTFAVGYRMRPQQHVAIEIGRFVPNYGPTILTLLQNLDKLYGARTYVDRIVDNCQVATCCVDALLAAAEHVDIECLMFEVGIHRIKALPLD